MSDNEKDFDGDDGGDDDEYGSEDDVEVLSGDEEDQDGDAAEDMNQRGTKRVAKEERITGKFMTKYERARILGARAL